MTSIQDVVNAAYRIQESAKGVEHRTKASADALRLHGDRLRAVARGNRTGEEAGARVLEAQKAVEDSAAKLVALQRVLAQFIQSATG